MEAIMRAERGAFIEEHGSTKNGFYTRNLDGLFGRMELKVPRDRGGKFETKLFEPYKRRDVTIDEVVISMFKVGMSARKISQVLERIFNLRYSPSTISRIAEITSKEIAKWKNRRLKKRYAVVMLDRMHLGIRRDTVDTEVVLIALSIDGDGIREVLDFEVRPAEGAKAWEELIARYIPCIDSEGKIHLSTDGGAERKTEGERS